MKTAVMNAVVILMILPGGSRAAEVEDCRVSLELLDKTIWEIRVGPKHVTGDTNTLTREGDVLYGFVAGKPVRFRVEKDRLSGRFDKIDASLRIEGEEGRVKIRGLFGKTRFIVRMEGGRLELTDQLITLRLGRAAVPDASAVVELVDESGQVRVRFQGCSADIMRTRPELALILHQMVLPRVADFEDVGVRLRANSSSSGPGSKARPAATASGRSPAPKGRR